MAQPTFTSQNLRNFIATSQGKSYTVAGVTALLVIVIILLGIFPAASAIGLQLEQNSRREEALVQIEQKRTVLRDLITEKANKEDIALALNSYLPQEVDQAAVIEQLTRLAAQSQVKLRSISFADVERRRDIGKEFGASSSLSAKVVSVGLDGEIDALKTFIKTIENTRRIYNLRRMSFVRQTGSTNGFRAEVQGEVYIWGAT